MEHCCKISTEAVSLSFHLEFQLSDDNSKFSSSNRLSLQAVFDIARIFPRFFIKKLIYQIEITVTHFLSLHIQ